MYHFTLSGCLLQTVTDKSQHVSCSANGRKQHMFMFNQPQAVVWNRDCCPAVLETALYTYLVCFPSHSIIIYIVLFFYHRPLQNKPCPMKHKCQLAVFPTSDFSLQQQTSMLCEPNMKCTVCRANRFVFPESRSGVDQSKHSSICGLGSCFSSGKMEQNNVNIPKCWQLS